MDDFPKAHKALMKNPYFIVKGSRMFREPFCFSIFLMDFSGKKQ